MRPGQLIARRFELEAKAGAGGMGEVWRARDRETHATVALKVMHEPGAAATARFAREARVLAELDHPGIVRHVAHGVADFAPYLAMEWLDGEDLAARLARRPLTIAEAVLVARQVAGALGAAHARGVVHRDVKPSNLFLVGERTDAARVLDFGIARRMERDTGPTGTGAGIGTLGYMAPEQARGGRVLDARVDVFALGSVLYECVAGRPAFPGEHAVAILAKLVLDDPPSLAEARPEAPIALVELVTRMLSKDPDRRPADGDDVARALDALDLEAPGFDAIAPVSLEAPALTTGEQRLMAVVLAKAALPDAPALDATLDPIGRTREEADGPLAALAEIAAAFGARVEPLVDGSVVAAVSGTGSATDLAARGARLALALRGALPGAPMAMATGRGDDARRLPAGEVLDRAAALVGEARGGVRLDALSASLLDARFHVSGDVDRFLLREREDARAGRTLLGKETPCVGRDRELASLVALYDECVADSIARVALIVGATGVGKSRVRHELLKRLAAHETPPDVWFGRGDELTKGSAYALLRPAVRSAAGIAQNEAPAAQQEKLRARVARSVPEAARARTAVFLGELVGAGFPEGDDEALRTARRDPMVLGDQIRLAWQDFLRAEASRAPLVLVLEDLHWGDVSTVQLVDLALRNVRDRPWMVLATARPEVKETFPDLWSERGVDEVRLGALTPRAAERLVRAVLGDRVTDARAARMVALSEGNALALEEFVRAAADGQPGDVPATVMAMASARLGAFDERLRRVMRAASVFGQVFSAAGVGALLGGDRRTTEVGDDLKRLEDREVIVAIGEGRFAGDAGYAFRHDVLARAAYAMLTDDDRALGHRLAGAWLERAGERDAMAVAAHLEAGGEGARAATWFVRAAEQAFEGNDLAGAIARVDRAAACGLEGEALARARLLQAQAHGFRNETAAMRARADEALALLPVEGDAWWEALGSVVLADHRLGDLGSLTAHIATIDAALDRGDSRPVLLTTAARAVASMLLAGARGDADRLLARVAALDAKGDASRSTVRAWIAHARGVLAMYDGDASGLVEQEGRALLAHTIAGDVRLACTSGGIVAFGYMQLGDDEQAEKTLLAVMVEADRMGLATAGSVARHNLGLVWLRRGKLAEGAAIEREAIDVFQRAAHGRMEGASRAYLAVILNAQGDFRAASEVEATRAALLLADVAPLRPFALAVLAQALLATEPARALTVAKEAASAIGAGPLAEGEADIRLTLADALLANGDDAAAREVLREAVASLRAHAARISDPRHRELFLANIPAHARTLRLARSLGVED